MDLLHLPSAPMRYFLFYWCEAKDCSCPFQTWQSHLLWIDLVTLDFSKHILKKNRELPFATCCQMELWVWLGIRKPTMGEGWSWTEETECVETLCSKTQVECGSSISHFWKCFILCLWIFVLHVCLCATACLVSGATWKLTTDFNTLFWPLWPPAHMWYI